MPAAVAPPRRWWDVLGVSPDEKDSVSVEAVERKYRQRCNDTHPDRNDGKDADFKEVSQAWDDFRRSRNILVD